MCSLQQGTDSQVRQCCYTGKLKIRHFLLEVSDKSRILHLRKLVEIFSFHLYSDLDSIWIWLDWEKIGDPDVWKLICKSVWEKNWYKANTLYLLYLNDAILLSGLSIPHPFSFVFQSIGEELVSLEKGSIEGCQAFIKKHSQNLHPNHYYLMVSRHIYKILCVFRYFLFLMLFEKKIFACVEKLSHFSPDSDLRNLKVCGHSLPSLHPLAQNTGLWLVGAHHVTRIKF